MTRLKNDSAGIVSEKLGRDYMEDSHTLNHNFIHPGWIFGGVYDGHGSPLPAEAAAKRIPEVFRNMVNHYSVNNSFRKAYETVSREMSSWAFRCGTCAANFLIKGREIFHANVGDARILVIGKKLVELTTDHRSSNEAERARIIAAGGEFHSHLGCLYVLHKSGALLMPPGHWATSYSSLSVFRLCRRLAHSKFSQPICF